ncbi:hypothetical protein B9Z48_18635 [Limnohabitans sp. WS1]|nr:hypothetical protein B9Z48_18635 [Limnohabitans sp. WS1]
MSNCPRGKNEHREV